MFLSIKKFFTERSSIVKNESTARATFFHDESNSPTVVVSPPPNEHGDGKTNANDTPPQHSHSEQVHQIDEVVKT
jgi:hypothetical protein